MREARPIGEPETRIGTGERWLPPRPLQGGAAGLIASVGAIVIAGSLVYLVAGGSGPWGALGLVLGLAITLFGWWFHPYSTLY